MPLAYLDIELNSIPGPDSHHAYHGVELIPRRHASCYRCVHLAFCFEWLEFCFPGQRGGAHEKQNALHAREGACPSALSRAPGFGVHRSEAETLDTGSGRSRRTVWPGRAVRSSNGKSEDPGEHDLVGSKGRRIGRKRLAATDDVYRSRIRERGEHLRSRLPYMAKALGKELGISVPQLDVVACGRTGFKPDCVANNERRSFRFSFADSA